MRIHYILIPAIIFLMMAPGLLQAKPGDGFSISIGGGQNDYDSDQAGDSVSQSAFHVEFDYQFAIGESYSISINGGEGGGGAKIASLPLVDFMKFGHLVLQGRVWFGSYFFGVHGGRYSVATTEDGYSGAAVSVFKSGMGFTIGAENEAGWFIALRHDQVGGVMLDNGPTYDISSTLLLLGFRFK
ncbi:MAG: hypothetical protein V3S64_13695 [bacterium]